MVNITRETCLVKYDRDANVFGHDCLCLFLFAWIDFGSTITKCYMLYESRTHGLDLKPGEILTNTLDLDSGYKIE